jgi:hypothetical protein
MNPTLELCIKLLDAGYQAEAKADPEAWNKKVDDMPEEEKMEGYYWERHPSMGWYPNPGRMALAKAIKEMIGDEAFEKKYTSLEAAKGLGHEGLMQAWLNEHNDKSN